jgi:hypothetical protein
MRLISLWHEKNFCIFLFCCLLAFFKRRKKNLLLDVLLNRISIESSYFIQLSFHVSCCARVSLKERKRIRNKKSLIIIVSIALLLFCWFCWRLFFSLTYEKGQIFLSFFSFLFFLLLSLLLFKNQDENIKMDEENFLNWKAKMNMKNIVVNLRILFRKSL